MKKQFPIFNVKIVSFTFNIIKFCFPAKTKYIFIKIMLFNLESFYAQYIRKNPKHNIKILTRIVLWWSIFFQTIAEFPISLQNFEYLIDQKGKPKCEDILDTQKASFKRLLILDISADRDTCSAELKTVCFMFSK